METPRQSSNESTWADLGRLATVQGGSVATWQAGMLDISPQVLADHVTSAGWTRQFRGVSRMPGVPPSIEGDLWAALLAVASVTTSERVPGPADLASDSREAISDLACATAWSAAERYGFDRPAPAFPQLLVRNETTTTREGIRIIRSRRGVGQFAHWVDGLPLALPPRVLWDASHLGRGLTGAVTILADLAIFFDRMRLLSVDLLIALVEESAMFGYPARPPPLLRLVAERVRPGYSHSKTEAIGRQIATEVAAELGIVLHPSPYTVFGPDGRECAEIDVASPKLRLGIEIDGPHHDEPSVQAYDRRRDKGLREDLAWSIHRFRAVAIDDDVDGFRLAVRRVMRERLAELASEAA